MFNSRIVSGSFVLRAFSVPVICLALAGCMSVNDPWGEGSMAYTVDEMHPIGVNKPCGQEWPNLANDESNHFSPNHGCAFHKNITAMIVDKKVIKRPKKLDRTPANTAVGAINYYEYYSGASSSGSSFGGSGSGSGSSGSKP